MIKTSHRFAPSRRHLLAGGVALSLTGTRVNAAALPDDHHPLIIGHRGAPGYMPEHTVGSYETAIRLGADYIEPDVVATKDGHLVVRHDPVLMDSTDILSHPEFADRKRTVKFQGFEITDFFVADFTLAEIKTLRARQVMPQRDHSHDGQYEILTLEEMIDIAISGGKRAGRVVGIYPEIKLPSYHQQIGLPIEDKLLATLKKAGFDRASSPVLIQSFETANLKYLKTKTDIRLMQLVGGDTDPATGTMVFKAPNDRPYDWTLSGRAGTYADLLTPQGLDEVATYAKVVAPTKRHLLAFHTDAQGQRVPVSHPDIIANAYKRGLEVHIWTMRDDPIFVDPYYKGDAVAEYLDFFRMGVDGVFTDFADTAVKARKVFLETR